MMHEVEFEMAGLANVAWDAVGGQRIRSLLS
jgi:hypothetical protein